MTPLQIAMLVLVFAILLFVAVKWIFLIRRIRNYRPIEGPPPPPRGWKPEPPPEAEAPPPDRP
ncbi:MAG: hypothetical protein ACOY93_00590 [Bacillota bacterium]